MKLLGAPKFNGGHDEVMIVNVNVVVAVGALPLKAVTVTVYVPAGCASVTRTTPVAGSPSSRPLKLVEVKTFMLVVFVGAASGVTVVLPLSETDVSG